MHWYHIGTVQVLQYLVHMYVRTHTYYHGTRVRTHVYAYVYQYQMVPMVPWYQMVRVWPHAFMPYHGMYTCTYQCCTGIHVVPWYAVPNGTIGTIGTRVWPYHTNGIAIPWYTCTRILYCHSTYHGMVPFGTTVIAILWAILPYGIPYGHSELTYTQPVQIYIMGCSIK